LGIEERLEKRESENYNRKIKFIHCSLKPNYCIQWSNVTFMHFVLIIKWISCAVWFYYGCAYPSMMRCS